MKKNEKMLFLLLFYCIEFNLLAQQTETLVLDNKELLEIYYPNEFIEDSILNVTKESISFTAKVKSYGKPNPLRIKYYRDFEKLIRRKTIKKIKVSYYIYQNENRFYIRSKKIYDNIPDEEVKINAILYRILTKNKSYNLLIISRIDKNKS